MNLEELVTQWHNEQPHPRAPKLKVGDYPVAMRLATALKFGQGHASPSEAENFWHEYQTMNENLIAQKKMPVGPEEFTHLAQQMGRSSFGYHGRPPSMYEIARLRDANPREIHDYYGGLPDEHYPTVTAAEMAKALHAARPWANQIVGRDPVKLEGAYFHHSGQNPADYYRNTHDGSDDQGGTHARTTGSGDAGGQQADPRAGDPGMAGRPGAADRPEGVPAR